jgi:hypothetical protein
VEAIAESEPKLIALQISVMLASAGWIVPEVSTNDFARADRISARDIEDVSSPGISVEIDGSPRFSDVDGRPTMTPPNERVRLAADALVKELQDNGIVAKRRDSTFAPVDTVRIFVGLRPGQGEIGAEYSGSPAQNKK